MVNSNKLGTRLTRKSPRTDPALEDGYEMAEMRLPQQINETAKPEDKKDE
jgi:hypothetical protein